MPKITDWLNRERLDFMDLIGLDAEREAILKHLLVANGNVFPLPPNPFFRIEPYQQDTIFSPPQEVRALSVYSSLLEFPPEKTEILHRMWFDVTSEGSSIESYVYAGGPTTHEKTAHYLPHHKSNQLISETFNPLCIPYHFCVGDKKSVEVFSVRANEYVKKLNHGIRTNKDSIQTEPWRPSGFVGQHNRLKTDFLLLSKLPRNVDGGEVIIICGGHGTGTLAFELLFDALSLQDLRRLQELFKSARYFQIVFEVSDIENRPPMSRGHSIGISKELTPVVISRSDDLFLLTDTSPA